MRRFVTPAALSALFAATLLATGCAQIREVTGSPAPAPSGTPAAAAAPTPAPAPAARAPAASGGVNARGEVIDSSKVVAGEGRKVKGRGDWEGEITGKGAANSGFNKLEIGMPMKQVTDLIGTPTDQGAYVSGKAFIPFYYGADRVRHEMVYKNQGRLVFASGGGFGFGSGSGNLIWIIHNPTEAGYR